MGLISDSNVKSIRRLTGSRPKSIKNVDNNTNNKSADKVAASGDLIEKIDIKILILLIFFTKVKVNQFIYLKQS